MFASDISFSRAIMAQRLSAGRRDGGPKRVVRLPAPRVTSRQAKGR